VFRAEKARVQGFVDKNTNTVETLKRAIGAVGEGRVYFSEAFREAKLARHEDPLAFDKVLTDRERVILTLIGQPMTHDEVAARLKISSETVEKHRSNILRKLKLQSTAELVRYAHDHGFTLSALSERGGRLLP
jgi:DNA-binding NarL/FixJ family response regulator